MIKIENIKKQFENKEVLSGISFQAKEGSIYGLIGKNGAGKTTLLNIIAGLANADSGAVNFDDGKGIKKIAFLPDMPMFFDHMTAGEYIDFLLMSKKGAGKILKKKDILELVDIADNTKLKSMSRGMKQKFGIASILVTDPDVILLDEPTSALDPAGRYDIMNILRRLKEEKKTIILSTHILSDMEKLCDKVGFLYDGKIVKEIELQDCQQGSLELGVVFKDKISFDGLKIPCYTIRQNENMVEFKLIKSSDNIIEAQRALFGFLSGMNVAIDHIYTLKPELETIFQEVCK